jgi:Domain of unknown function (DUF6265)
VHRRPLPADVLPALAAGLWTAVAVGCMSAPPAVPAVRLDPIEARPPAEGPLRSVAFLAGCWRGTSADGRTVTEERWSCPGGGLMLGTGRTLRDGELVGFEFSLLRADEGRIVLLPYPAGVASEHAFRLTEAEPGRALFEAPEHDFPKRIAYVRRGSRLDVRIDGGVGGTEARAWALDRVACDG